MRKAEGLPCLEFFGKQISKGQSFAQPSHFLHAKLVSEVLLHVYSRRSVAGSARTGVTRWQEYTTKTMYFGIYAVFAASIRKIVQQTGFWK